MSTITDILTRFGLLDDEQYLVPPEHPNVPKLVQNIFNLRLIVEEGKLLTDEQRLDLIDMEAAKDYYDDALDEELQNLIGQEPEDEEEDEPEEEEELEDSFIDDESLDD